MGTLNIWLSIEDEAFMRRQMELAGESQLGSHIKRVYFGNLKPGEGVLAELRRDQQLTLSKLTELVKSGGAKSATDEAGDDDRALELRLLAAIFLMLEMSIGKDQKLIIGRYVDRNAIENYLKSGGEA